MLRLAASEKQNVTTDVYPAFTTLGCDFHFKQAIKEILRKHGLLLMYNKEVDCKLSHLPPEHIVKT